MSQRRMISLDVIDTDAFLDMPQSSQLLYFHLNARADDDGFVSNPKRIMRSIGSSDDDLKVLTLKKFLILFQDGVCVIKHWRINNFIRKDIYKETKYLDLKQTLFIRPNGAYTQKDDDRAIPIPPGHFQMDDVNDSVTERQLSIGKVSIDKDSIVKEAYGESGIIKLSADEHKKLKDLMGEKNLYILIEEMDDYLGTMTETKAKNKYSSHYKALRTWARRKVENYKTKKPERYIA